jgi:hypothetical protein
VTLVRVNRDFGRLGALTLSIFSTVLVFVIIPAAILLGVSGLVLSGSDRTRRSSRRYRPGRPYDFQPIWFLAAPDQVGLVTAGAPARPAIEGPVLEDISGARVLPGPTGGASDSW